MNKEENPHAKWLRLVADEMFKEGGGAVWGNTCSQAADEIDVLEQRLAAAEECLRSRNCDDLCLIHIQRAEAAEKERDTINDILQSYRGTYTREKERAEAAEKERDEARFCWAGLNQQFQDNLEGWKETEAKLTAAETALQAAREGMREPTAEMIEAGWITLIDRGDTTRDNELISLIWKAMHDVLHPSD